MDPDSRTRRTRTRNTRNTRTTARTRNTRKPRTKAGSRKTRTRNPRKARKTRTRNTRTRNTRNARTKAGSRKTRTRNARKTRTRNTRTRNTRKARTKARTRNTRNTRKARTQARTRRTRTRNTRKPRTKARTRNPRKTRTKARTRNPRKTRINVVVTDGRGRGARAPGLTAWLAKVAPKAAPSEITIALVSDARIRSLNRTFRRKDTVTDVLSFEPSDLAIATGVARRQAREAGHSYADELKVLALHGLLHLMGYDHHARSDQGRMARMERRLRTKGGLVRGLIERASNASEPRKRSAPAKRRASARVGESEGRGPSVRK